MSETACRIRHSVDDHEFRSAAQAAKEAEAGDPAAMTTVIHALKASIEPTVEPPVKTLDELKAERPGFAERLRRVQPPDARADTAHPTPLVAG
jgi:hypothetical protein